MRQPSIPCRSLVVATALVGALAALPAAAAAGKPVGPCCRAGDKEQRTIVYDYATSQFDGGAPAAAAPVAPNTPVVLKVTNINPFRHKAKIAIEQTTYSNQTTVPAVLSDALTPKAGASSAEKKDAKMMAASVNAQAADQAETGKKLEQDLQQATSQQIAAKGRMAAAQNRKRNAEAKRTQVGASQAQAVSAQADTDYKNAKTDAERWSAKIKQYKSELKELKEKQAVISAQKIFLDDLKRFNDATDELDTVEGLAARLKQMALDVEDAAALKTEVETTVAAAFQHSGQKVTPDGLPGLRAGVLGDVEDAFRKLQDDARNPAVQSVKDLQALFQAASDRRDTLNKTRGDRDKNFDSAVSIYTTIEAQDFGTVISGAAPSTGDEVEVELDDSLTKEAGGSDSSNPKTILIIPVVGQRHLSFSTGVFFTGLNNPKWTKGADNFPHSEHGSQFTPILGALVHTPVLFCGTNVTVPLSFGVALQDSVPVYILGGSLILGRSQRTAFTVGVAGGQLDQPTGLKADGTVDGDTVATRKVFRTRFVFGLTYNFPAGNGN